MSDDNPKTAGPPMPVVLDPDAAAVHKAFQEAGRPETLSPLEARLLGLR
ncbi:hypothetical protein [Bradyrhizobium hipponense]|nr:hypothetical protein [Bradyrhizobium hipponense]